MMQPPLLVRKLEAVFDEGTRFYGQLASLCGIVLVERYRVLELLEVGGQGILYRAADTRFPETPLLLKMPLREYHRPGSLSPPLIQQSREAIRWEAYVLERFAGTILPEYYDFLETPNPLHDTWWNNIVAADDPFLVMEYIQGETLDDWIGARQRDGNDSAIVERLARMIAREFFDFCVQLYQAGMLYTDMRPANIMLANEQDRRGKPEWRRRRWLEQLSRVPPVRTDTPIRLIDAGSIVPHEPRTEMALPIQLAYAPPEFFRAVERGEPTPPPTPDYVLYTLGKTLWQMLLAQEPVAGQDPEFRREVEMKYSAALIRGVRDLLGQRYGSFERAQQENILFA